ncbi:MAG TPA: hypothetical protein VMO78_16970 [Rhizomicrobium sp.]|nr:hypothetical protein [Rhizomicrobium sp.]
MLRYFNVLGNEAIARQTLARSMRQGRQYSGQLHRRQRRMTVTAIKARTIQTSTATNPKATRPMMSLPAAPVTGR